MSGSRLDVDKYRTEFECDEHWELRRKFLLAHRDKFPEDELVCLAQTFTNIEFLGCRYPQKTMEKVARLAEGVVDEYRERQKGRLQRTFVAASDAAGAKVKGSKHPQTDAPNLVPEKQPRLSEERRPPDVVDLTEDASPPKPRVLYGPTIHSMVSEKAQPPSSRYGGVRTYHIQREPPAPKKVELPTTKYGKLLIVESETTALNILLRSVCTCNIPYSLDSKVEGSKTKVKLIVNSIVVAECEDESPKAAKEAACRVGLEKLKETCYTINVKYKFLSDTTVDKSFCHPQLQGQTEVASMNTPISEKNVGSRLLRMMGWEGGGLGREAQGIEEPVGMQQETVRRAGFGSQGVAEFREQARKLLQEYATSDTTHDLVFTNEFSADERKVLHLLGHKLQLKTKSWGKREEDRFVVVSRKTSFWEEANKLLASGGSSDRYDLIPPHVTL